MRLKFGGVDRAVKFGQVSIDYVLAVAYAFRKNLVDVQMVYARKALDYAIFCPADLVD